MSAPLRCVLLWTLATVTVPTASTDWRSYWGRPWHAYFDTRSIRPASVRAGLDAWLKEYSARIPMVVVGQKQPEATRKTQQRQRQQQEERLRRQDFALRLAQEQVREQRRQELERRAQIASLLTSQSQRKSSPGTVYDEDDRGPDTLPMPDSRAAEVYAGKANVAVTQARSSAAESMPKMVSVDPDEVDSVREAFSS